MKKKNKQLSILTAICMALVLMLTACSSGVPKKSKPTSVSITNSNIELEVGSYLLEAVVLPADASQDVVYELVGATTGVSLKGNSLVVDKGATAQDKVTVKVTSSADKKISSTKEFTIASVKNIVPTGINILTPQSVSPQGSHTLNAQVLPVGADQGVTYSLAAPVEGVAIVNNKELTISSTLHNDTHFTVNAVSTALSTVTASKVFYVNNPLPPTSVSITNTVTKLNLGSNTLTAAVLPAGASQEVTYEIVGEAPDVSIINNVVEVGAKSIHKSTIQIKVFTDVNHEISGVKDFIIHNPEPSEVRIMNATTALNTNVRSLTNFPIEYKLIELEEGVTFTLLEPVVGVTLSDTGIVSLADNVANEATFTVEVASTVITTLKDTITFTVTNPAKPAEYEVITNKKDLMALANTKDVAALSKNYKLMADIDVNGEWIKSIGDDVTGKKEFLGTFDGQGHTISNFGGDYTHGLPFFNSIGKTGVVRNVEISMNTVNSNFNGGAAAAISKTNEGIITDVRMSGTLSIVNGMGSEIGAFVVTNKGIIADSVSTVLLKASYARYPVTHSSIAHYNEGSVVNVFVDKETSESKGVFLEPNPLDEVVLKATADMQTAATYFRFDKAIWNIVEGSYPTIIDVKVPVVKITNGNPVVEYPKATTLQIATLIEDTTETALKFSLAAEVAGVTVNETTGLVTITDAVAGGAGFTVVAALASNTDIKAEMSFGIIKTSATDVWTDIGTKEELLAFTATNEEFLSKNYRLTADIDVGEWNNCIGGGDKETNGKPFTGKFDGQGHTLSNFGGGYQKGVPLFYELAKGASVINVGFITNNEGSNFNVSKSGVITLTNNGIIANVSLSGHIGIVNGVGSDEFGAIVRTNNGIIANSLSLLIKKAHYAQDVVTNATIARTNAGTISNVFVDKTVTGAVSVLGGAGSLDATLLKTTEELKKASTYSAFDTTVWTIVDGEYAKLIKK